MVLTYFLLSRRPQDPWQGGRPQREGQARPRVEQDLGHHRQEEGRRGRRVGGKEGQGGIEVILYKIYECENKGIKLSGVRPCKLKFRLFNTYIGSLNNSYCLNEYPTQNLLEIYSDYTTYLSIFTT